jgi:hypothetical protein
MKSIHLLMMLTMAHFCAMGQTRDSLIQQLIGEIERQDVYVSRKVARIDEFRRELRNVPVSDQQRRFTLLNELYHEYKSFVNDSAFHYSNELIKAAQHMNDPALIGYGRLKLGFTLLSAGMFKEAMDALHSIEVKTLADSSLVDYYRLSARSYADLMVYNKQQYFQETYDKLYGQYLDSALMVAKPESYLFYYMTMVKAVHQKDYRKVIEAGDEMMKRHQLTQHQLAVYYYDRAEALIHLGDDDAGAEHILRSAMADIRGAVKETAAMYTLARFLHNKGDSHNAYIFIQQALKDAQFYGARQRQVEINSILPFIAADQLNTLAEQRKRWLIYSIGITFIVVLVIVFTIIILRQLKKIKAADAEIKRANDHLQEFNRKLVEADRIKEEYVGYYFNMTTDYVNRIDALRKQVMNFLVNDKKKEALTLLGKYNPGEERAKFVKDFDQVFLRLFPDFVQQFNKLINPAEPILPDHPGELNSDLRIFALIRLGIHDNKKISEILNFSVNTIYAYKTRVKNKTIVPDDVFLERVMAIKSVEGE